jgi:hypothetical protein
MSIANLNIWSNRKYYKARKKKERERIFEHEIKKPSFYENRRRKKKCSSADID